MKHRVLMMTAFILGLAVATITSPAGVPATSPVHASEHRERQQPTMLIAKVSHQGGSAYTGMFSTAPQNGKSLDIWVDNRGESDIFLAVRRNDQDFVSDIRISPGTERTQHFVELAAEGINGDWQVYIYTKTGDLLNLRVEAKQQS